MALASGRNVRGLRHPTKKALVSEAASMKTGEDHREKKRFPGEGEADTICSKK